MTGQRMQATTALALITLVAQACSTTQSSTSVSDTLPATATAALARSLDAARRHQRHVWRDTPPFAEGGLVNAYVEIPRGERQKFELDIAANARRLDRVIPSEVGGYPVNYGFVPQTVSYDGDPFDALVLGPPLEGGTLTAGVIVGVLLMADAKGSDSKVVLSPTDPGGRPRYALTAEDRERIGTFFDTYKRFDPGGYSRVDGWGTADDGRAFVNTTHAFFRECRTSQGPCVLKMGSVVI